MATIHATTPALPDPAIGPAPWPISVDLYAAMLRSGILAESDRVYLWDGRLAARMTTGRPHTIGVLKLSEALRGVVPAGSYVEPEQPMALGKGPSVPYPDVKVVRGRMEDYPERFPTAADVPLVAEVADSSLALDRRMAATYAGEGIPAYWIVNIPDRRVEVYGDPEAGAYRVRTSHGPDDDVPVMVDGREFGRIAVRDILP